MGGNDNSLHKACAVLLIHHRKIVSTPRTVCSLLVSSVFADRKTEIVSSGITCRELNCSMLQTAISTGYGMFCAR